MFNTVPQADPQKISSSMVPSFQDLLRHIANRNDETRSNNLSPCTLKAVDSTKQFLGSPVSNTSPSCSSSTSVKHISSERVSEQNGNMNSSRQDFWTIVLGPSRSLSLEESESKSQPSDAIQKPHACRRCSLRFKKRCNLQSHVRSVHEKIRPFSCGVCFRRFGRKSNCAKHMRLVHRMRDSEVKVLPAENVRTNTL